LKLLNLVSCTPAKWSENPYYTPSKVSVSITDEGVL